MAESILGTVKTALGLAADQPDFDAELMLHINSVLSILNGLGVGPVEGFMITDGEATWEEFLGSNSLKMNDAKMYMMLRVRILWDPPQLPHLMNAFEEQIREIGWRLNVTREETEWIDPNPLPSSDLEPTI